MAYNPLTSDATPKITRSFRYDADGSDVGQNRQTQAKNNKNPISIANPLAISERFGTFDMRENVRDVISDQLKMIILTNKGERVGNYDFGANVRQILFETDVENIEDILAQSIQENVAKYMPGVRLSTMDIFTSDQVEKLRSNEVLFKLGFSVGALNLRSQIELVIAR